MPLEDTSLASEAWRQLNLDLHWSPLASQVVRGTRAISQLQGILVQALLSNFHTFLERADLVGHVAKVVGDYVGDDFDGLSRLVGPGDGSGTVQAAIFVRPRSREVPSVTADAAFAFVDLPVALRNISWFC